MNEVRAAYYRVREKVCLARGRSQRAKKWRNLHALERLRHHFDPSVPPQIRIEIGSDCNFRCAFCPQAETRRPSVYLTDGGLQHLLDQLRPLHYASQINFNVSNEPFLHPRLLGFCRAVATQLPLATTQLITNGSLITREHLCALTALPRPPLMTVNDYTTGHGILKRLAGWLKEPELARLPVTLVPRSPDETLSNRAGNLIGGRHASQWNAVQTCSWPFIAMSIAPTLKAYLCCSDYANAVEVGDLNTTPLMEVWNGAPLRAARAALLVPNRRQQRLCDHCDAEYWVLPEHCC